MAARHRVFASLAAVFLIGAFLVAVPAQDQTAADLLKVGLAQVDEGKLEQGKATLLTVDPVQLSKEQRQQLQQALQAIAGKQQEAAKLAADKAAAEKAAADQVAADKAAADKAAADKAAAEKAAAAKPADPAVADKAAADKAAADAAAAEKVAADKAAAEKAAADTAAAEKAAADKMAADKLAAEKVAADKAAAEKAEADKVAAEKAAAEKLAMEKAAAEKAAAEKAAADKAAADKAAADAAAEKAAAEKAAADKAAADKAAAEKAAADKVAADKAAAEKAAADAAAAEKAAAEKAIADKAAAEAKIKDLIRQAAVLSAQQHVAQAEEAVKAGQPNSAEKLYQTALTEDPTNQEAKNGLEKVREQAGRDNPSDLSGYKNVYDINNQQAKARFEEAMRNATEGVKIGNFRQAEDAAAVAKAIIDTKRQFLSEAEYARMNKSVLDFQARMQQIAEADRAKQIAQKEQEAKKEQTSRAIRTEQERERKVQELLRRSADLRKELNYEQSLDVLEQVLFLDPHNVAAQAMKEMIEDSIVYRNRDQLERTRALKVAHHSLENIAASIPTTEIIEYPADWPQLTNLRLSGSAAAAGESDANRRTMEKLKQPIPIQFDANRFENVVEYLRNVTGVNFFVNWKALEGAGIEPGNPITLSLANVPADKALRLILDQLGGDLVPLSFTIDDGVVTISTTENINKNTNIRVYDIRDLLVQAANFNDAPDFDLVTITKGNQDKQLGQGGGGGGNQASLFKQGANTVATRTELTEQIMNLIQESVDPDGWRKNGGLTSAMSEHNGSLIVTTTSQNHRKILDLLGQLRETRALQINVEARFLLVTQNYLDEVGVDMDITINGLGSHFSPIVIKQESIDVADRNNTGLTGSFGSSSPGSTSAFSRGIQIAGSYLNDVQVDLLVRATQANRYAISLSAPRVTFFNGQRAYVLVSTQLAFVSDLTPAVGTGAVGFQPTLSVVSSGIVLDVEGTVSADRRYVTLTARPSLANIVRLRTITVQAQAGNNNNNNNNPLNSTVPSVPDTVSGSIEAPELELTTLRTTVSVPDRGTLLMGGQRLFAEIDVEAGVPVLSKIPYINRLFTNRSTVKDERTLLILIKPTIIIQSEKENELFPGLNSAPELFTGAPSNTGAAIAPPGAQPAPAP